jgi:hypothetical protein
VLIEAPEETTLAGIWPVNAVSGDMARKEQVVDGYFSLQK